MVRRKNGLVAFSRRAVWPLGVLALLALLLRLSPLPLKTVFIVLFTSILLAAAVAPAARFMERHFHVPRGVSVLAVYLLVLLILIGVVALIVPLVLSEVNSLTSAVPGYVADLQRAVQRVAPDEAQRFSTSSITGSLTGYLSSVSSFLADLVFKTLSLSIDVILILVMAYFLAVEEDFASLAISRFVPPEQRPRAQRLLGRIGTRLGQWARAQMLLALFFGVAFGIGLRVMGLHYAVTLGVVGGVLEIIPYVGGFITVALAILVALTQRPILVIPMLVWYAIVVEAEGHVIAPKLMDRVLHIHPLVVVVALFLGAEALGILGALLAVPIAIVVQGLLDEFYSFPSATPAPPPEQPQQAPPPAPPDTPTADDPLLTRNR